MEPLGAGDPEWVGRYRLTGRLGEGGMGRVYLGRTPEGQQAAVKVIRDELAGDTGFRQRFRREVSAAVAVAGMFTARVLDADPDADPPWLATQFVEGPTLRELVYRAGPLDEPSLLRLAQGLAEALSAIHAAGLVHRDLKPANVLLATEGAKVIDFGIAQSAGATQLTGTGELIGTPEYMSPEQVAGNGPPGPASDLFAMGATLCFAATGGSPFAAGHAAATLYRILQQEPDLQGVPDRLLGIVRDCLAKDPAQRPTAPQVAAWLRAGALPAPPTIGAPTHPGSGPTTPHAPRPQPTRSWRRGPLLAALAAVLAVTVGGVTALALTGGGRTEAGAPPSSPPSSTPPTTTSVSPPIDPDGPEARYVRRLCQSGNLLVTLADGSSEISTTGDPEVARSEYLATADRSIGVIDTALADFRVLRDDAPTDEVRRQLQLIIDEFTAARASLVEGRDIVEASDPLMVEAYSTGVDRFRDATRNLALIATLVENISLPPDYLAAGDAEPACA